MDISKLKPEVPASVLEELPLTMEKFSINTPLRLSHFLAQVSHESGNFNFKTENLNYSADGLVKIFKKYFPTIESAKPYERNQQKIGNKVYANRMGNGSEESGDGYKYRGRGFIQLTGKSNYIEFDKDVPEDLITQPEWVSIKYSLLSAAWFWNKNSLNTISDLGDTTEVVTKVRKKVNGGSIGLDDCIAKFKLYKSKLT